MDGYASRVEPSLGVHDDLYLHAVTICGERCVSILVYDLLYLDEEFVSEVRRRALELGVDSVVPAAIHTHSGPITSSDPRHFLVPVDLDAESAKIVDAYRRRLIEMSAACIKSSLGSLSKARVGFAAGRVNVCFNRRGEGAVDDSLHIVRIDRDPGDSVSILNYSCHPVVLGPSNRYISADYPGAVRNVFEANMKLFYSTDTTAVFLSGACGDVNPATCRGYECSGTFRDLYAVGGPIAFEALKLYSSVRTEEIWDLRFRSVTVRLPIRPPPPLDEAEKRFRELRARYSGDYRNPALLAGPQRLHRCGNRHTQTKQRSAHLRPRRTIRRPRPGDKEAVPASKHRGCSLLEQVHRVHPHAERLRERRLRNPPLQVEHSQTRSIQHPHRDHSREHQQPVESHIQEHHPE